MFELWFLPTKDLEHFHLTDYNSMEHVVSAADAVNGVPNENTTAEVS